MHMKVGISFLVRFRPNSNPDPQSQSSQVLAQSTLLRDRALKKPQNELFSLDPFGNGRVEFGAIFGVLGIRC